MAELTITTFCIEEAKICDTKQLLFNIIPNHKFGTAQIRLEYEIYGSSTNDVNINDVVKTLSQFFVNGQNIEIIKHEYETEHITGTAEKPGHNID